MGALGTATIDFGAFPGSNEATVNVTGQTGILGTSNVEVFIMADDSTSDHIDNDHRYIEALGTKFTAGTPSAGVGFTIYGRSIHKLQGTFKLRWIWAD